MTVPLRSIAIRRARRTIAAVAIILAVLVLPRTAPAQDVDLEAIDRWIESVLEDWDTPGVAVGVTAVPVCLWTWPARR